MRSVIDVMETEKLLNSGASVDVLPSGASFLVQLGDDARPASPAEFLQAGEQAQTGPPPMP